MPLRINVPPLTRGLLVSLLTFTLLNASLRFRQSAPLLQHNPDGVPFIAIVPQRSIKYPWVMLTASLVEQNLFSLAVSALTIFYGGRYLERAWGSSEYAKFLLFVTVIPNVLTFITYILWFILSGNSVRGFVLLLLSNTAFVKTDVPHDRSTTIHGALALEAAFLVAFKQLVPEHTVSLLRSLIRIRVKHFPAIFVLLNSISGPLLGTDTALFLGWFGFLTSWIYLRFYRVAPSLATSATGEGSLTKGDASDTFAFSHFFPDSVQHLIDPLCDSIYKSLVAFRICTPFSEDDVDAGNEQATARAEGGLPSLMDPSGRGGRTGVRREEAERRRALALRALDQRLNAAAANRANAAPDPGPVTHTETASVVAHDAQDVEKTTQL